MSTSRHRLPSILQKWKHLFSSAVQCVQCTHIFYDSHLQRTYKTFSSSRSWSQIQILPQQWHASLVQTSCQELPGFLISSESVTWCFEMLYLDVFGTEFVVGGVVVASSVTNFHDLKFFFIFLFLEYFDLPLFSCPRPCLYIWPWGTGTRQLGRHPCLSFCSFDLFWNEKIFASLSCVDPVVLSKPNWSVCTGIVEIGVLPQKVWAGRERSFTSLQAMKTTSWSGDIS